MGLVTRQTGPNAKGSKLTATEMDNNLYYLQSLGVSGVTYSANTLTITNPTGGTISTNLNTDTYTSTTVNITSADILNMDTTPITLLPTPGANKYYDIDKIILEYTYGTQPFISGGDFIFIQNLGAVNINTSFLVGTSNYVYIIKWATYFDIFDGGFAVSPPVGINTALTMNSLNSISGTGDGTIRAIISYKVRTFGS